MTTLNTEMLKRSARKMSIALFNAVPTGAIEVLSDAEGLPHFKRADLGRFLGLVNVKATYRELKTISRKALFKTGDTPLRGQNDHNVFLTLDGAMEIIVRSNKPKAIDILEKMGSKIYRHKYVRKETETLSYIQRAFKGEEMINQYCVDGYSAYFSVRKSCKVTPFSLKHFKI